MQSSKLEEGDTVKGGAGTGEFVEGFYTTIKGDNFAGIFTGSRHSSDGDARISMTSNEPIK